LAGPRKCKIAFDPAHPNSVGWSGSIGKRRLHDYKREIDLRTGLVSKHKTCGWGVAENKLVRAQNRNCIIGHLSKKGPRTS
jgi:hypothetical protein